LTVHCPIHGLQPTDEHHTPVLRKDGGTETVPMCRLCHREHHRRDVSLHKPGQDSLQRRIVSDYFRNLRRKLIDSVESSGMTEREYMSELGKSGNRKRWGTDRHPEAGQLSGYEYPG
jgi:hypothetical protein